MLARAASVALLCALGSAEAWAAASGLQSAINEVYSQGYSIVQPLSIIAIIALGIGAMNGKITWTQALVVAIGISIASDPGGIANMIR